MSQLLSIQKGEKTFKNAQFNRKISTNQQKDEGSDSNLIDSSFGHHSLRSSFRVQGHLWSCAWEAEPEKWHQIKAQPTMEYVFPSCIDFTQKKSGKVFKSCKAALRWNLWNFNQDFTFRFRAVVSDSKWIFIFLQSRLLILSHPKWRGVESSWEFPIVSLQQTQSMLGAQSFSIVSGPSKTIRCSFVSSLFSHIVLCSPGLHLNTSALLGKHLLHVCPVPGKSWKTDAELPGGILLVGLSKRPSLIDHRSISMKYPEDIRHRLSWIDPESCAISQQMTSRSKEGKRKTLQESVF